MLGLPDLPYGLNGDPHNLPLRTSHYPGIAAGLRNWRAGYGHDLPLALVSFVCARSVGDCQRKLIGLSGSHISAPGQKKPASGQTSRRRAIQRNVPCLPPFFCEDSCTARPPALGEGLGTKKP